MSSSPPAYTPPPPLPRPPALHTLALLPPVITSSKADFAAKLSLVQEVAAAYTRTPRRNAHALVGYTYNHESEYQAKRRNKDFTPSMHALLFSLSEDVLQDLAADPLAGAAVCDRAQAFISMGMGHKSLMATAVNSGLVGPTLSWIPSVPRSNRSNRSVLPAYTPRFEICILTGEPAGVERVPIVPRGLLASDASAALFAGTSLITDGLHGDGFAAWIAAELRGGGGGGGGQTWNSLPLSAYMRERYNAGDLAFRPRGVDAGCRGYRVHFSAHWLHETNVAWKGLGGFFARPSPATIEEMLATIPYGSNPGNGRGGMAEFSMFTGRFVCDGDVFSVGFATYDDARRMMCMLTFRWNVAVIFCLAGMEEWPQLDEDGEVSLL